MKTALAVASALLVLTGCAKSAEQQFTDRHARSPRCDVGTLFDDCSELATYETDRAKKLAWLERGCKHAHAKDCVEIARLHSPADSDAERERLVELLRNGCEAPQPMEACALLVDRHGVHDATSYGYAERACFLGGGLDAFGVSLCEYVARSYANGTFGHAKDLRVAAVFSEVACAQERALGERRGAHSCVRAARMWQQEEIRDLARARTLLELGCSVANEEACGLLRSTDGGAPR